MFIKANLSILVSLCGVFTSILGVAHFFFPHLFHYKALMYPESNLSPRELEPFRLGFFNYPLSVDKLYGLIWLMNNHVSFVLVSIGLVEFFYARWLLTEASYLLLWFAAWWLIRAGSQLLLSRSWRSWMVLLWFLGLSILHVWIRLVN
jgi:hypothetical protein